MLTMSGNLLSLAHSKMLSKFAAFIPVTWRQAILQITGYLPALESLFGTDHPLTLSHQQGLTYVQDHQDTFGEAFAQELTVGSRLAPAILVCFFNGQVQS